tara:strand:+ start:1308 stop:1481 length:174 start_codon:yes stop_codon:yes gene_type:complete
MLSIIEKFKNLFKPDAEDIERVKRWEKEHRDRVDVLHKKARKHTERRNKNKTLSSNF